MDKNMEKEFKKTKKNYFKVFLYMARDLEWAN
jgi:hypothetical protein